MNTKIFWHDSAMKIVQCFVLQYVRCSNWLNYLHSSGSDWLKKVPWGMRKTLNWIKEHYDNVPVIITESGMSDVSGPNYEDNDRILWLRDYIDNVLKGRHYVI